MTAPVIPPPPGAPGALRSTLGLTLITTVLAALLATAATLIIHRQALAPRYSPRLATVDVVRLVDEQQAAMLRDYEVLSAEEITRRRPQATQRTQAFARELDAALSRLGEQCRCVLVNRAAVLGGAALTDHTERLRAELLPAVARALPSPTVPPAPAVPFTLSAGTR